MLKKGKYIIACLLPLLLSACGNQQKAVTADYYPVGGEYNVDLGSAKNKKADTLAIARLFIDACGAKAVGDFEGATILFGEVLKSDPRNVAAMYELGRIYFEFGKLEDAAELLRNAAEGDQQNKYYQATYGNVLLYMARYQEAVAVFEWLTELEPEALDSWIELSFAYERAGKVQESIRVLTEMESLFGPDESILMEQYRMYVRNGRITEAIAVLNRLIDKSPSEPAYYGMLMELYEMTNDTVQARKAFEQLLQADPGNADLLFKQAEYQKAAGETEAYIATLQEVFDNPYANIDRKVFVLVPYADSIDRPEFTQKAFVFDLAERLVKAHPLDAKAFAMQGDLLYYGGSVPAARQSYVTSTTLRGDVYDVWVKLFTIDAETEQWDSLQAVTQRSIELFPNQAVGYYFSGVAANGQGNSSLAIAQFKRALPMAGTNSQLKAEIWLRMGDVYHALKEHASSDNAYDQSLLLDPNNPYTLNNYAYYLSLRKERLDDALQMAAKAIRLVPDNANLLDTYAWVLYQQGNYKDARIALETALKNGGTSSAVVLEHMGDVLYRLGEKENARKYWQQAVDQGADSPPLLEKISTGILHE
ncbi:MAG: hypothetical protein ABR95_10665 [Sphingobacteriales bacterium BACL12 MAG-120813-bin55]|jgi:tetratricopeptide (TPR) repeat protein|nr:MAG: hypothetical protein ABR94_12865 [Sphingobacteriales bacterium BACL12 MAG-120802-bin5]KRP13943.1 MAG: hypothetical protein ABR95_10665 [Sphingobacteriales bacterium BACL12 MAG-120813-bin55]